MVAIALRIPGLTDFALLGKGGFASVYRAYQSKFDRHVAVKVLSDSGFDEKIKRRFEREQQAMGSVSGHPGIVTLYDAGFTSDGAPYLVMELMSGGSMQDRLKTDGPLPWAEAIEVIRRISDAVALAHERGVMHRDIKPDNVLISEFGEYKLTDFGIATLVEGAATATTSVTATLEYAPPEILSGKTAIEASDVYALAATLFALVSGQSPFKGESGEAPVALLTRVLTAPIPDLRPLGTPVPICEVIEWATAKDPGDRPPTAAGLSAALAEAAHRAENEDPAQWSATRVVTPEMVSSATAAVPATDATRAVMADDVAAAVPPPPAPAPKRRMVPIAIGALAVIGAAVGIGIALSGGGGEAEGATTTAAAAASTTAGTATTAATSPETSAVVTTAAVVTTTTEPPPDAPAWACAPGEAVVAFTGFDDLAAPGWDSVDDDIAAEAPGWGYIEDVTDPGNAFLRAGYSGLEELSSATHERPVTDAHLRFAVRFGAPGEVAALQVDLRFGGPVIADGTEYESLTLAAQFQDTWGALVQLLNPADGAPVPTQLGTWDTPYGEDEADEWHGVEIVATGTAYEVWIDGTRMVSVVPPVEGEGSVSLLARVAETAFIDIDDFQMCSADAGFESTWPWDG